MTVHSVLGLQGRIKAIGRLSEMFADILDGPDKELLPVIQQAKHHNPWFTERFVKLAIEKWRDALLKTEEWIRPYGELNPSKPVSVGVVNAGNIPFAGLHDLLSVLVSGHNYVGKNATGDNILLPFVAGLLIRAEPSFRDRISFVERISGVDAVIATGNNNSARYFEFYFGKLPHIIRRNRNGAGVLTGEESEQQLVALGLDIFSYFGLGCRNVSKLYVPEGYNFNKFFEAMLPYSYVNESSKYMNNFEYNNSVFLLKLISFLQNGFLIIREEKHIASPISVVHYEKYSTLPELAKQLSEQKELLQCIATGSSFYEDYKELKRITVPFGQTQSPQLWDYADGVDTMKFLGVLGNSNH